MLEREAPGADAGPGEAAYFDETRLLDLYVSAIKIAAAYHGHGVTFGPKRIQDEHAALMWAAGQGFVRRVGPLNAHDTLWALTRKGAELAQAVLDHGAMHVRFDGTGGWTVDTS